MPISLPPVDERNYAKFLDELVRRIAVDNPEWTDFNQSDPGVTVVELFAFLAESLLWQIEERQRQRRRRRRRRLVLLAVGTAGAASCYPLGRAVRSARSRARQSSRQARLPRP